MAQALYSAAAVAALLLHLLWLLFVISGALFSRGRGVLTVVHIAALAWGIAVEIGPWPCPLTWLELYFQEKAGIDPYQQPFLVHYLDKLVYPGIPESVLIGAAVFVCGFNLLIYIKRLVQVIRGRYRLTHLAR